MDSIIFIHVDEPEHQHEQSVDELKRFLENTRQVDYMLLDACPILLPPQELKDLERTILNKLKYQSVA